MDGELEVQSTIKRAELMAFLCLLMKVIGPIHVHVDNKGIRDGLWGREMHRPKADEDLLIKNRKELHQSATKEMLIYG